MSTVSILIPAFNREKIIGETIDSAINQTFRDIEIIVVDNCSSDQTYKIAMQYAEKDTRVRVFRSDENIGPVRNWIKCAEYARSPYGKILFSDDLIAPEYIEKTLPHLISNQCGFVFTPAIIGSEPWAGGVAYKAFIGDAKLSRNTYIRTSLFCDGILPVSPGAALFRTDDLLKNIKTDLPGISDYDFSKTGAGVDWLIYVLTSLNYDHVQYVDQPLCFFRAHEGSLTIKNENNMIAIGQVMAKQWLKSRLGL